MSTGLNGRHRDHNGEAEKKHGNTKMKTLKVDYPQLKHFHNETRLADAEKRVGVESLDALLKKVTVGKGRSH